MQSYLVPRGQFIFEQRFERRFLYPFNAVLFVVAIISIVRTDWVSLGICVVACFLTGLIAGRLPKNRTKSFAQLTKGLDGDIEPTMDVPQFLVDRYPTTNALLKCSYVAVATGGAIAYHLNQSQWTIAGTMVACFIGVMLIGTMVIATSRVE